MLRLREGVPVTIDVTNAGADPDIVHWHGLAIDSLNDGAMEEGSPMIAAGQTHRYTFTPNPPARAGITPTQAHAATWPSAPTPASSASCSSKASQIPPHYDQEVNPRDSSLGAFVCSHGRDHARRSRPISRSPRAPTLATNTRPSTITCSAQASPSA